MRCLLFCVMPRCVVVTRMLLTSVQRRDRERRSQCVDASPDGRRQAIDHPLRSSLFVKHSVSTIPRCFIDWRQVVMIG